MVDARLLKAQAGQANEKIPLRRNTGVDLTSPFELDEADIPHLETFAAASTNIGLVTGGVKAANEAVQHGFNPKPIKGYKILDHIKQDAALNESIQPILDRAASEDMSGVLDKLRGSQSPDETNAILRMYHDRAREQEAMAANPLTALAGTIAGILPDLALAVAVPAAAAPMAVAKTAAAQRLWAALRVGVAGAIEGGAERSIQGLTNPLITPDDIVAGAAMGGGVGGVLGAVAPKLTGNVMLEPRNREEMLEQIQSLTGRSVGAAAADEAALDMPAAGAQGLGLAKKLGTGGIAQTLLRSPKRMAVDVGVLGREQARKGLSGNLTIYDKINKLVRLGVANEADVSAFSGRSLTAQDYRDAVQTTHTVLEKKSRELYTQMQNEVFGANKLETNLRDNSLVTFGKKGLTQEEFEGIADEFAQARGEGLELDFASFISDDIADRVSSADMEALKAMVVKKADMDDEFYMGLGKQEVELGLIEESALRPGYRPQVWNVEALEADPEAFDRMIEAVFAKTPDDAWLVESQFIQPGETWQTLLSRDPEAADEAMGFWENAVKAQLVKKREAAVAKAEAKVADARQKGLSDTDGVARQERVKKLEASQSSTEAELAKARRRLDSAKTPEAVARAEKQIADHSTRLDKIAADIEKATEGDLANAMRVSARQAQKTIDEQTTLLGTITNERMRQQVSNRISKAERRLAQAEDGLKRMQDETAATIRHYDDLIASFGKRTQRKALKKAEAGLARAEAAVQRAIDAPDIGEQSRQIRLKLLANKDPFGLPDADVVGTSSRFKNRALNLGRHRSTPAARKFLRRSGVANRGTYVSSVAPQIALQRAFGGGVGRKVSSKTIMDEIDEAFELDRTRASDADKAALNDQRKQGRALLKGILDEFTGADRPPPGNMFNDAVSLAGSATSLTLLNSVAISQLADIVVVAAAGGRLGTGLKSLVSVGKNRKFVQELEAMGEDEVAMIVRGPEVFDGSRMSALSELDDVNVPGGKLANVARWTNNAATINGWASLMHVMNRAVRGSFGADMARQIGVDVGKFKDLKPALRTFYSRLGIGEVEADAMAAMLQKHHHDVQGAKLPNSAKWAEEAPDLLALYKAAMKAAGDEAMITPSVGDRPFLRSYTGGKLVLQFQSFTFTMADRFLAPMIQRAVLGGPEETARAFGFAVAALGMGGIVGLAKAGKDGRVQEWSEQSARDHMYEAFLRGPFLSGSGSTFFDTLTGQFGAPINDGVEKLTGVRPLKESQSRFRNPNPITGLAGPAASTLDRAVGIGAQVAEGDLEGGAKKLSKMLPVIGTFYIQAVTNAMNEE